MRHSSKVFEEQKCIVRKALVREVTDSNERWPVYKCPTCNAIEALARKFGLDIDEIWQQGLAQRAPREVGKEVSET